MSTLFHDFQLILTSAPEDEGYRVVLTRSQRDDELASTGVPGSNVACLVEECARLLGAYPEESMPGERLEAFGKRLAEVLLPPEVRRALLAQLRSADPIAQVRLRLTVKAPLLDRLPWEYSYLEAAPPVVDHSDYLCLHTRFHLVRQVVDPQPIDAVSANPLRVLIAWSDPDSARYPRLPHRREEVDAILAALRTTECRHIETKVLPSATRSGLHRALQEWSPHVLHFLGHGDTSPTGGILILESGRPGAEDRLYGDELAEWLSEASVRLAVLSACRTASPMRGIARALSARRIPAVVGMQLPMRSATSQSFARVFYGKLAQPDSVEEAISEARQILRHAGPDWGVLTLYLTGETSSLFDVAASATSNRPTYSNLPYFHDPNFVGREEELLALHRHLQAPDRRPVAIVGLGGLGKTQLASEYALRYSAQYPGGIFWINGRDTLRIRDDYAAISGFFDVPETLSNEERAQRMRVLLQQIEQPALLILDNVTEDTHLVTEDNNQSLLPAVGQCRILATTREGYLVRPAFRVLSLPVLADEAALTLLQAGRPATSDEEEAAARDIAALLGHLPLALALVAHHVRRLGASFTGYRARLEAAPMEMLGLARKHFLTTTKHNGAVFDAIGLSHLDLSQLARNVLSAAACFASRGIPTDLLFATCDRVASGSDSATGASPDDYAEALAELEDFCLITRQEDGRLSVHELVQVFARGQMNEAECRNLLEHVAVVLADCLPQEQSTNDLNRSLREVAHCHVAAELCRKHGVERGFCAMLYELGILYFENGHGDVPVAKEYFQEGMETARRLHEIDNLHLAHLLSQLGAAEQVMKLQEEALAHVQEAVALAEKTLGEDSPSMADFWLGAGFVLKLQNRLAEALDYYSRALNLYRLVSGDRSIKVAESLHNIGWLLVEYDDLSGALLNMREALAIYQELYGWKHVMIAVSHNNVGQVLAKQGAWAEAFDHQTEALTIARQTAGQRRIVLAASLYFVAECLCALGRSAEAVSLYQEALLIYVSLFGAQDRRPATVRSRLDALDAQAVRSDPS